MDAWNKGITDPIRAIKGKKKRLLQVMFEPDNDNVGKICKQAGIAKATYYKYVSDPNFAEAVKQLAIKTFAHRLPMTVQATLKEAEKGNMQATRLVLEALQLAGKGASQTVNVGVQANEAPTANMDDMTDEEILAMLDEEQAHIDAIRKGIETRRDAKWRENIAKGHGIHPRPETTTDEEA